MANLCSIKPIVVSYQHNETEISWKPGEYLCIRQFIILITYEAKRGGVFLNFKILGS
jgi:hypothetical protein